MKKYTDPVLAARRDAAESYARRVCSILWRADRDLIYTITADTEPRHAAETKRFFICQDQLYSGVAYSYNAGSLETWLDIAGQPDEDGVYSVTGLNWKLLSGSSATARIGIDCSSTVIRSWQSIGAAIPAHATDSMTEMNGFLPVGEYAAPKDEFKDTIADCAANGEQVMYKAYARLQKADAIVMKKPGSGHTRLVYKTLVIRGQNGLIDGDASFVFCHEQCGNYKLRLQSEEFEEDISPFCRVEKPYSFKTLFETGYLPVTIRELVDPAPIPQAWVKDSVEMPSLENLFIGTITANRGLDAVIIEIFDGAGQSRQKCLCRPWRSRDGDFAFRMQQFLDDGKEKTLGAIDLDALPAGSYRCTVTARAVGGQTFPLRDFTFEK